jgi:hypothetical protein
MSATVSITQQVIRAEIEQELGPNVVVDVIGGPQVSVSQLGLQGPQGAQGPETFVETGPEFTYTNGALTRIDYDSANYKLFNYFDGVLASIVYHKVTAGKVITKTFNYVNGVLVSIDQTEV